MKRYEPCASVGEDSWMEESKDGEYYKISDVIQLIEITRKTWIWLDSNEYTTCPYKEYIEAADKILKRLKEEL